MGEAQFGAGTGNIFLDDVMCSGFETFLIECFANFNHDCIHAEDAGVICRTGD